MIVWNENHPPTISHLKMIATILSILDCDSAGQVLKTQGHDKSIQTGIMTD